MKILVLESFSLHNEKKMKRKRGWKEEGGTVTSKSAKYILFSCFTK